MGLSRHGRAASQRDAGPRVAVLGSGYVGIVAACLAWVGRCVVGVETNEGRLASFQSGRAPFHEAGLDALLKAGIGQGSLHFTADTAAAVEASDVVFLDAEAVPVS